jgi:hypothetical protein
LSTPQGARGLLVFVIIAVVLFGAWWLWENKLKPAPAQVNAPTTVPTDPFATSIRIATWNLRKFSERDKPGQFPPDLVAIAGIIKSSSFDLVAIQEVQQTGQVVQKLRRQLGEPWRHYISPQTGNNERYAFLYRADRVETWIRPARLNSIASRSSRSSGRVGSISRWSPHTFGTVTRPTMSVGNARRTCWPNTLAAWWPLAPSAM